MRVCMCVDLKASPDCVPKFASPVQKTQFQGERVPGSRSFPSQPTVSCQDTVNLLTPRYCHLPELPHLPSWADTEKLVLMGLNAKRRVSNTNAKLTHRNLEGQNACFCFCFLSENTAANRRKFLSVREMFQILPTNLRGKEEP